jgi:hypothetical protein
LVGCRSWGLFFVPGLPVFLHVPQNCLWRGHSVCCIRATGERGYAIVGQAYLPGIHREIIALREVSDETGG